MACCVLKSQTKIEKRCFFIGFIVLKNLLRKKTKETVKQELLNSVMENNEMEEPGLGKTANATKDTAEAIKIIQRYEEIIKIQNKKFINFAGKQG